MQYIRQIIIFLFIFSTNINATSAEITSLTSLENRAREIINIIEKREKSSQDSWIIEIPNFTIHTDIVLDNHQVGAIGIQEILEGLINAHNERYSQLWLLSKHALNCCNLIITICQRARTMIAQRTPEKEALLISTNSKITALEHLKSRINLILYALSSNETLARFLHYGNWRLPSPELLSNAPHFTRISWSIISYNVIPKSIIVRPGLEALLESLKLVVLKSLEELKR